MLACLSDSNAVVLIIFSVGAMGVAIAQATTSIPMTAVVTTQDFNNITLSELAPTSASNPFINAYFLQSLLATCVIFIFLMIFAFLGSQANDELSTHGWVPSHDT